MEYLDGESLAERLEKGALSVVQVLQYGTQIASDLDKAHHAYTAYYQLSSLFVSDGKE